MKEQDLREAFSKAHMIQRHAGPAVLYTDKDGWINQELEQNKIRVFQEALQKSSAFLIRLHKGKAIELFFKGATKAPIPTVLPAMEKEVRKEISLKDLNKDISKSFALFFSDVDMEDESAVLSRFSKWIEKKWPAEPDDMRWRFDAAWKELCHRAGEFSDLLCAERIFFEPDGDFAGGVEIRFPERFSSPIILANKKKECLYSLLEKSSLVALEMNVKEGFLNSIFFR